MNNLVQRFATKDPTICAICRRTATGVGYSPANVPMSRVVWLCDDPVCHHLAKGVYHMPQARLDVYEAQAARLAIDEAGPYLDEIGTTDLASLNDEQMDEFLRRLIHSFEDNMRRQLLNYVAPF